MAVRMAHVEWTGDFRNGSGTIAPESGNFTADYSSGSILGGGPGSNPTEILAAAVAGCFSSTFAGALARAGFEPSHIQTDTKAHMEQVDGVYTITRMELHTKAEVGGIDSTTLQEHAVRIATGCPVGKAISSVELIVTSELV